MKHSGKFKMTDWIREKSAINLYHVTAGELKEDSEIGDIRTKELNGIVCFLDEDLALKYERKTIYSRRFWDLERPVNRNILLPTISSLLAMAFLEGLKSAKRLKKSDDRIEESLTEKGSNPPHKRYHIVVSPHGFQSFQIPRNRLLSRINVSPRTMMNAQTGGRGIKGQTAIEVKAKLISLSKEMDLDITIDIVPAETPLASDSQG